MSLPEMPVGAFGSIVVQRVHMHSCEMVGLHILPGRTNTNVSVNTGKSQVILSPLKVIKVSSERFTWRGLFLGNASSVLLSNKLIKCIYFIVHLKVRGIVQVSHLAKDGPSSFP